jgi:hypothetical protein
VLGVNRSLSLVHINLLLPSLSRGLEPLLARVQVEARARKGPRSGCACYAARQAAEWGLRYGVHGIRKSTLSNALLCQQIKETPSHMFTILE